MNIQGAFSTGTLRWLGSGLAVWMLGCGGASGDDSAFGVGGSVVVGSTGGSMVPRHGPSGAGGQSAGGSTAIGGGVSVGGSSGVPRDLYTNRCVQLCERLDPCQDFDECLADCSGAYREFAGCTGEVYDWMGCLDEALARGPSCDIERVSLLQCVDEQRRFEACLSEGPRVPDEPPPNCAGTASGSDDGSYCTVSYQCEEQRHGVRCLRDESGVMMCTCYIGTDAWRLEELDAPDNMEACFLASEFCGF